LIVEKQVKSILLTCGETSGEHHASRVVSAIKEIDPDCRILALGGDELERAGAEIRFPMDRYAVMGFSEVLSSLPRFLALERKLKAVIESGGISLFMPVDYPGLNLRLARTACKAGVPVLYFISPQVWAWGRWRVNRMRGVVDMMAVILPFEERIYKKAGIPVIFAGHPMLDEIDAPDEPKVPPSRGDSFDIVLFPGSRRQEVGRLLPPMLGAVRILKDTFPGASFKIGAAPLIDRRELRIPADLKEYVTLSEDGVADLEGASLVLAASGTVTLQAAISGTPMVVSYRTSLFTYLLGRLLVRLPWIAMPNVLAGRRLVPELIQADATDVRIAEEAAALLLDGDRYRRVSKELLGLRDRLKGMGCAAAVADTALRMAGGENADSILP